MDGFTNASILPSFVLRNKWDADRIKGINGEIKAHEITQKKRSISV
jgi:hypothetical protein